MPNWKKLISSGSAASLSSLSLDTALPVSEGGTGATSLTSNGILTGNGTSAIQAESNLTFDGSTYMVLKSADGSEGGISLQKSTTDSTHTLYRISHRDDNQNLIIYSHDGTTFRNWITLDEPNALLKLGSATANPVTINSSGDVSVLATSKLYLDGGSDSYIYQSAADIVNIYTGGENTLELSAGGVDPRISYFNKDNRDRDFSFCGDTNDNVVYFDASVESLNLRPTSKLFFDGGGNTFIYEDIADRLRFFTGGAEFMRFTEDTSDQINLYHNTYVTGDVNATGDVVAYYSSDKRLKDNIIRIENPLEKVSKIGGYTFDWNDKQQTYTGKDVGVIAQEIQEVLPELVTERDNGYLAVKYEKIVPLLIESIKELKQEIDDIKQKCDCLNK